MGSGQRPATPRRVVDERGAVAVIVGVSLVLLFGFAAMVIDLGAVFEERRDLQNGADAAALGAAIECASGGTCSPAALQSDAESIAGDNSNDGRATVSNSDIVVDLVNQEITVTTHTFDTTDGDGEIDYVLAPVLGQDSKAVSATASAGWGSPSGAASLPITISACEWGNATGGLAAPTYGDEVLLQFHANAASVPECADPGSPGHDVDDEGDTAEGGFGFLDSDDCSAEIIFVGPDLWIPESNGAAHPGQLGCPSKESLMAGPILIPIFDDIETCSAVIVSGGFNGNGKHCYHIMGFGAFSITEMNFGGQWKTSPTLDCDPSHPGNGGDCMLGYFTELVLPADLGSWSGTTPDLGVVAVALTG